MQVPLRNGLIQLLLFGSAQLHLCNQTAGKIQTGNGQHALFGQGLQAFCGQAQHFLQVVLSDIAEAFQPGSRQFLPDDGLDPPDLDLPGKPGT